MRGFCFPAIRQGYSRDAEHQYPCHIVELYFPDLDKILSVVGEDFCYFSCVVNPQRGGVYSGSYLLS